MLTNYLYFTLVQYGLLKLELEVITLKQEFSQLGGKKIIIETL